MAARRRGALLGVGLALLLAGGCSDDDDQAGGATGPEAAIAAIEDLSADEHDSELLELARGEGGALRVYTSLEENAAAVVIPRFEKDTGVKVDLYRAKSEDVLARAAKEVTADVPGPDVVETNAPGLVVLAREDAWLPYDTPARDNLIEGSAGAAWTDDRLSVFTVSRNTDAISEAEAPRRLQDLGDPKWKGRVAMEADDADWYLTVRDHWVESEGLTVEEADDRFEAIARNARVVEGHSFMGELLAAGEFDVTASDYTHTNDQTRSDGAPVAWKPPADPLVARANAIAISGRTRHPYKAMLYVDWLLGPGQEVLREQSIQPVRRDLMADFGVDLVRVDEEGIVDRMDEAIDGYRNVLKLAGKGPEEPEG